MTIERFKEIITNSAHANDLVVECDISSINGDIESGSFSVICEIKKTSLKQKRIYISRMYYAFENDHLEDIGLIWSEEKRLK